MPSVSRPWLPLHCTRSPLPSMVQMVTPANALLMYLQVQGVQSFRSSARASPNRHLAAAHVRAGNRRVWQAASHGLAFGHQPVRLVLQGVDRCLRTLVGPRQISGSGRQLSAATQSRDATQRAKQHCWRHARRWRRRLGWCCPRRPLSRSWSVTGRRCRARLRCSAPPCRGDQTPQSRQLQPDGMAGMHEFQPSRCGGVVRPKALLACRLPVQMQRQHKCQLQMRHARAHTWCCLAQPLGASALHPDRGQQHWPVPPRSHCTEWSRLRPHLAGPSASRQQCP